MTIQNSTFDGTDHGLVGVRLRNTNQLYLGQCEFKNYESVGVTNIGLELDNVTDAFVSVTDFLDNEIGAKLNDVFNYSMFGGRIEQTSTFSNFSSTGILVPTTNNVNNLTNIYMTSSAIIKNQTVGIDVQKGGLIDGTNTVFGLVSMDCAKLINNGKGIRGIDVTLEIDALVHCGCNSIDDASPNTFIKWAGPQGNSKFFDICYDDLNINQVTAQGNFWSGGNQNVMGNCTPTSNVTLLNTIQAPSEPTRCTPIIIDPPKEPKSRDRDNGDTVKIDQTNLTMEVFPNPTDGEFTIALKDGEYMVTVTNLVGKTIFKDATITGNTTLNSSDWPKGIYFVEAVEKLSNQRLLSKLLVQ